MELVAHRAGNRVDSIPAALDVTDTIELDVHLFRRRLEVRHSKVVWPFAIYWERWYLTGEPRPPQLAEVLAAIPVDAHIWLDLKGFSSTLAKRAHGVLGDRRPVTVSTRNWWTLRPFRRVGRVRTFRSVGSRWQLWAVQRLTFRGPDDGIVMHERFATDDVMRRLLRLTPNVVVWAVDDFDRASELARIGVTGIIADDLDLIARMRSEIN